MCRFNGALRSENMHDTYAGCVSCFCVGRRQMPPFTHGDAKPSSGLPSAIPNVRRGAHETRGACRAIFTFASHLADDRLAPHFWAAWEAFEGRHGNAATWREMTRIHRSVAASFSAVHFNTTNVESAVSAPAAEAADVVDDPMAALEAQAAAAAAAPKVGGFVSAGVQGGEAGAGAAAAAAAAAAVANPEELDIGDDDDDMEDDDGDA